MTSRLHAAPSRWATPQDEAELYPFHPNAELAPVSSQRPSESGFRFQQRFYVSSSEESSSCESVSTGDSGVSSSSQYTYSSEESAQSASSQASTRGSSSEEGSDCLSSMAHVDVLYQQDIENQRSSTLSEDESSCKSSSAKEISSNADSVEESDDESGDEISIHSGSSDVDEVEDENESNERSVSFEDHGRKDQEIVHGDTTAAPKVDIDENSRKKKGIGETASNVKVRSSHGVNEEKETMPSMSEEDDAEYDLSGDETDTCNLSIEEHLNRRLGKWTQYRKQHVNDSAPSQKSFDDATIDTTGTHGRHEKATMETGNLPTRDPSWDRSYSTDSSVIVKIMGCEPPSNPRRTIQTTHFSSRKRRYSGRSELSPVEESEWSKSKDSRPLKDNLQKGPLKHVEYFSALDQASTCNDLSTVGPMSKSLAEAAFLPPKGTVKVPVEIQTLILEDLEATQSNPYNGQILAAPPLSVDHDSTVVQEPKAQKKSGIKAKVFRDRSDVEIFCLTLISLTLVLLLIMLVVVLVRDK